jgi:hypothetical protein
MIDFWLDVIELVMPLLLIGLGYYIGCFVTAWKLGVRWRRND